MLVSEFLDIAAAQKKREEAINAVSGQALNLARGELRLSQGEVASSLGLTRQTISAWEMGRGRMAIGLVPLLDKLLFGGRLEEIIEKMKK